MLPLALPYTLAKAPLHVAGKYKVKGTLYTAMDCAISYVPSLLVLLYARSEAITPTVDQLDALVLIVKMPETEGAKFCST